MATTNTDAFTLRMFEAVNGMMLDVLAAVARKDYEDRRRRQEQGQAKAKAEGRYKGRPEDTERNATIAAMLAKGLSWSQVQSATDAAGRLSRRLLSGPPNTVISQNAPGRLVLRGWSVSRRSVPSLSSILRVCFSGGVSIFFAFLAACSFLLY